MKKILIIVCLACVLLCACTPHTSETLDTTPAATEPKPTPGLTAIAPSETPVEIIDPIDPSEGPVVVPLETPAPTPEITPAPTTGSTSDNTPDPTPAPSPDTTPAPTPETTQEPTKGGIDLPWIPA